MQSLSPSIFPDDRDLIPTDRITDAQDQVESVAIDAMTDAIAAETRRILMAAEGADAETIMTLPGSYTLPIYHALQSLWSQGHIAGEAHGIEAMIEAVPRDLQSEAQVSASSRQNPPTFSLSLYAVIPRSQVLAALMALFEFRPLGLRNTAAERAISSRVFKIAGNFSQAILAKLRQDLLDSVTFDPLSDRPISRVELEGRIQKTLNVSRVRAEMISRTETTYAYNQGRVSSFKRSALVSHVRFLAISDSRTTDICRSRNGLVIPIAEATPYRPPLHVRCRSVLSPLLPVANPAHQKMLNDPQRNPDNRTLIDLPNGWIN